MFLMAHRPIPRYRELWGCPMKYLEYLSLPNFYSLQNIISDKHFHYAVYYVAMYVLYRFLV